MTPVPGTAQYIAPGVACITAPNPGPMTGPGTNSYIVGTGPCVIIDPGMDDADHLAALTAAAPGPIAAIVISHAHPDHSGGAQALARATGAPVRAHPARLRGIRDDRLMVDQPLVDGEVLELGEVTLETVHTPGHTVDHLCFYTHESRLLLAGDTVMADVTVVILPPDGRMTDYFASLERLQGMAIDAIAPGHGRVLHDPAVELRHIVDHRRAREAEVHGALTPGQTRSAETIADDLYTDLDPRLRPVAAAQVQAHLIRLAELGEAAETDDGWRLR